MVGDLDLDLAGVEAKKKASREDGEEDQRAGQREIGTRRIGSFEGGQRRRI